MSANENTDNNYSMLISTFIFLGILGLIIYFYVPIMNKKSPEQPTPIKKPVYRAKISFEKMQTIYLALCEYVTKNNFAEFDKNTNSYKLKDDLLESLVNQKLLTSEDLTTDQGEKITFTMLEKQRRNFSPNYLVKVMGEQHIYAVFEKLVEALQKNPQLLSQKDWHKTIYEKLPENIKKNSMGQLLSFPRIEKIHPEFSNRSFYMVSAQAQATKILTLVEKYVAEKTIDSILPRDLLDTFVQTGELSESESIDPWGNKYTIDTESDLQTWKDENGKLSVRRWFVYSNGPDGKPGNRDDIDGTKKPVTADELFKFQYDLQLEY